MDDLDCPEKITKLVGTDMLMIKNLIHIFTIHPGGSIKSRISRCYTNIASICASKSGCCQKVSWFSPTGDLKRNVQAAKSVQALNITSRQPRDLTAYEYDLYLMRGRSLHISATIWNTKGDSQTSLKENAIDNNNIVSSKSEKA